MTETTKPTSMTATRGAGQLRHLDLFDEMQREFAHFWEHGVFPRFFSHRYPMMETASWAPSLDAFESNGELVIRAEIPGVDKDAIKVTIEGRDLIIEGERKSESEVEEERYYRMERTFGSFYRRLPLPEGVTSEDVHAEYKEGILEIRLPELAPTAPAKQITVK